MLNSENKIKSNNGFFFVKLASLETPQFFALLHFYWVIALVFFFFFAADINDSYIYQIVLLTSKYTFFFA